MEADQNIVRRMNAPIVVSSSVAILPGQTLTPPLEPLNAPFRSAMWIDEISFMMLWGDVDATPPTGAKSGGGIAPFLWARFNLGRVQLSEKYVPIWNYTPTYDAQSEMGYYDGFAPSSGDLNANEHFRWILPRPLFVAAGNVLVPSYQLLTKLNSTLTFASSPITVRTTYRGRVAYQKRPDHLDVPFVGIFTSIGDSPPLISTETDLRNPYDKQIDIQRLIGRCYTARANSGTTRGAGGMSVPPTIDVTLRDGDGYTIAQRTPFDMTFDTQRSAMTFSGKLGPKSMYDFQMVPSSGTAVSTNPVMVSFVGTRQESMEAV